MADSTANLTRLIDWDMAIRMTAEQDPLFVPITSTDYLRNSRDCIQISNSAPLAENALVVQKTHLREMVATGAMSVDAAKHHLMFNKAVLSYPDQEEPRFAIVLDSRDTTFADALQAAMGIPLKCYFLAGGRLHSPKAPDRPLKIQDVDANVFYWPRNVSALSPASLYAALIALVFGNHDVALISRSQAPLPAVGVTSLRDQMIFSRRVARSWLTEMKLPSPVSGRVLHFETLQEMSTRNLDELLEGAFQADDQKREFWTAGSNVAAFPYMAFDWTATPFPDLEKPTLLAVPMKFAVGGVERITLHVAEAVRDRFSVVALALEPLSPSQVPMDEAFVTGCRIAIPGYECVKPRDRLKLLTFLQREARPEVVWFTNGSTWLRDNAKDVRRIFSGAGIVDQQAYDTEVGWITSYQNEGVRSFDRFIAVTPAIRSTMLEKYKIEPSRIDLIHHPIDVDRIVERQAALGRSAARRMLGLPEDATVICFAGRMVDQKNPRAFVELALARRTKTNEHFVMVGDGVLKAECEALVRERGLSNFLFVPNVENIADVFSGIDLLVICSLYEGLPLVLIEAICLGVPVVSTDVGDVRDTLSQFSAGITLKRDASIRDFCFAIDKIFALASSGNAVPIKVSEAREHFSVNNVSRIYKQSWEMAGTKQKARAS